MIPKNDADEPLDSLPKSQTDGPLEGLERDQSGTSPKPGIAVVGIGASAGGLEAFQSFFAAMPANSGAGFVLIPHLDPRQESLMVEILTRQTPMPVVEAIEGMEVRANRIHILPPNRYMTIVDGKLRLSGPIEKSGPQTSIDLFFRSLAADREEKAVAIIFSGTGAHGSQGIKEIKAKGGLVLVQDPKTAEHPGMPECARATGLADSILDPGKMPQAISSYFARLGSDDGETGKKAHVSSEQLKKILDLIKQKTKYDFRCYRKPMLFRRIERRLVLGNFSGISDYIKHLEGNPDEAVKLYRDFLISVTTFFRDREGFEDLAKLAIEPIVLAKEPDSFIRVWSVGCATGEEPYSLGILFFEAMAATQRNFPVQIFATDVDEAALDGARAGVYPEIVTADLSPERLRRHFVASEGGGFQVAKHLRDLVTFARQNLVTDPPFSKMDLVVCRNVLIYLEPEVQEKVIALLHFSLNEGGYLFLGPSETVGKQFDLFEPISKKWRIFRKVGLSRPERVKIPISDVIGGVAPVRRQFVLPSHPRINPAETAQKLLLDQYAPPALLVNRKHEILYYFGNTSRFLAHPEGMPTQDLMSLTRDGLRAKLRSAIQQAMTSEDPVRLSGIRVKRDGREHALNVTVRRVRDAGDGEDLFLIAFEDSGSEPTPVIPVTNPNEETLVRELENELEATREDLRNSIEELEGFIGELRVAHEETMSMNEELQSSNEELETSKEELQSLNEELATVNNQLQEKVNDLEIANNDMANLLNSTEVGILFLDNLMRIRRFTPPATKLFSLIPADIGRPISDITPKFSPNDLAKDLDRVMKTMVPDEKQVRGFDGSWWSQKITLYRTLDQKIEGTILTFNDLTQIRRVDDLNRRLGTVLFHSNDAVYLHGFDGRISAWNPGAEKMFGYTEAEAIGMDASLLFPLAQRPGCQAAWEKLRQGQKIDLMQTQRVTKNGRTLDVLATISALKDEIGQPFEIFCTERDITVQMIVQNELRTSRERLGAILESAADAILTTNSMGVILSANGSTEKMFGYGSREILVLNLADLLPPSENGLVKGKMERFFRMGDPKSGFPMREFVGLRKNGQRFPLEMSLSHVEGLDFFTVILRDITRRKRSEEALRESERFARATLDGLSAQVAILDQNGVILAVNRAWLRWKNGHSERPFIEGYPFLQACESDKDPYGGKGLEVVAGIRAVLDSQKSSFETEFQVDHGETKQCFLARATVFPGAGLRRVVLAHEDITRLKQLEREVVEIASLELRRIGQDLHDSVGQELTALNLLSGDLSESLKKDVNKAVVLADRISQGLKRTQLELRDISSGLLPVAVDSEGLMAALSDLAEKTRTISKINCSFQCPRTVGVADNLTATHLYLIAQEAVNNAVKHSQAKKIIISMVAEKDLVLTVMDDGKGFSAEPTSLAGGLGLRIMRNRAAIIGAQLSWESSGDSGTLLRCVLPGADHGGD